VLRQLCSIRRSVPSTVYQTLIVALVMDYGNATLAASQLPYSIVFSPSSKLLLVLCRSPAFVTRLTSQTLLSASNVSTGYVQPSESSLSWRSSSTELFTARRLVTCPTCCVVSLTCHHHHLRSSSTSRLDVRPPVMASHCRELVIRCCWSKDLE